MAIVWRLVIRGSERWGRQLFEFFGGFRGWGLGLAVWISLKEDVLIWLTSRWGEIAVWILRGG